jgi:hypothetical protein
MRTSPISDRRNSHHAIGNRTAKPGPRLTVVSHSDRIGLLSDCEKALRNICRRARSITGATGAAIAVGFDEAMYCRATSGTTAPSLGTRIDVMRGLSGRCVQTCELLLCTDTQNDSRVDAAACKELGVRSILVVPLRQNNEVLGIFEILSSKPNAFSDAHVQEIIVLAREILHLNVPRSLEAGFPAQDSEVSKLVDDIHYAEPAALAGVAVAVTRIARGDENISDVANAFSITGPSSADQLALATELLVVPPQTYTTRSWSRPVIAFILLLAGIVAYQWRAIQFRKAHTPATPVVTQTGTRQEPDLKSTPTQPTAGSSNQPGKDSSPTTQPGVDIVAMDVGRASARIKGGLPDQDLETTRLAADSGDTNAEYQLGLIYANGAGVAQNYVEAMRWFEKAARNGSPAAQWRTGLGYAKGIGVVQDERMAAEWFKKAANNAHIGAQLALSQLYLNGRGVPKDYVRAYTWASIARGTRDDQDEKLKSLASRMTPTEITDAQQRIAAWWSRRVPTSGSR